MDIILHALQKWLANIQRNIEICFRYCVEQIMQKPKLYGMHSTQDIERYIRFSIHRIILRLYWLLNTKLDFVKQDEIGRKPVFSDYVFSSLNQYPPPPNRQICKVGEQICEELRSFRTMSNNFDNTQDAVDYMMKGLEKGKNMECQQAAILAQILVVFYILPDYIKYLYRVEIQDSIGEFFLLKLQTPFKITHIDGNTTCKNGDIIDKNGYIHHPNGDISDKKGYIHHPNGDISDKNGYILHPNDDIHHLNGKVTHIDGSSYFTHTQIGTQLAVKMIMKQFFFPGYYDDGSLKDLKIGDIVIFSNLEDYDAINGPSSNENTFCCSTSPPTFLLFVGKEEFSKTGKFIFTKQEIYERLAVGYIKQNRSAHFETIIAQIATQKIICAKVDIDKFKTPPNLPGLINA